jgi:hypothetical protein
MWKNKKHFLTLSFSLPKKVLLARALAENACEIQLQPYLVEQISEVLNIHMTRSFCNRLIDNFNQGEKWTCGAQKDIYP